MSLVPNVTVEQSALNALQAWLAAGLPGVAVDFAWPDPEKGLSAKSVTLLRAGARRDEYTDPEICDTEDIHGDISAEVATADPGVGDLPGCILLVNDLADSYTAHIADLTVHQAADVMNVLTAPMASDLASANLRANDLKAQFNLHVVDLIPHENADLKNGVVAPNATDLPSLRVLVIALKAAMNSHFVARINVWRLRACRLPVQLDVWATYEAVRDQMMAQLEPLLNADPFDSAGQGAFPNAPVRNGTLVSLGDGWSGVADFDFQAPRLLQTDSSQQVSEFRAVYEGFCDFVLMVKAQSPRLAKIILKNQIDSSSIVRTTTVTSAGSADVEG